MCVADPSNFSMLPPKEVSRVSNYLLPKELRTLASQQLIVLGVVYFLKGQTFVYESIKVISFAKGDPASY